MAITDKEQGVWDVDQVYNKINQGGIWEYTGAPGEPGGLWQTGYDYYGRLGNGEVGMPTGVPAPLTYYSSPVQAPGVFTTSWSIGSTSKARGNDGTLWSWGFNPGGLLGLNDEAARSRPTQIGTDTTWTAVSQRHATKSDGTLWAMGPNTNGILGLNASYPEMRSSPTQVGTDTTWTNEVNSNGVVSWIKTDGTLWVWGYNNYGALGLSQANAYISSPTQIPSPTSFSKMAITSSNINGGITSDGTLYMWGANRYGALGLNQGPSKYPWQPWFTRNHFDKSAPNAVPGNWAYVQATDTTVLATKTDGTLWYWGSNGHWNGFAPAAPGSGVSSPVQIGTDTTWTGNIWHTSGMSAAVKTDGTVWSWGLNPSGSLGHNDLTNYSSPKQIPGTNWTSMEYSTSTIALIKPG